MVYYFDLLTHHQHNMRASHSNDNTSVNQAESNESVARIKRLIIRLFTFICGDNFKSSRRRFWFISLCFAVSSYIMCIANVLTEYRWKKQPKIILPDIVFDFADAVTPSITQWIRYPDLAVDFSMIATFLWLLFTAGKVIHLSQ